MTLVQFAKATDPTEFVSLTSMKAHLRVDSTDDDILITELMQSACDEIERQTSADFFSTTWDEILPCFGGWDNRIVLKNPPLTGITYIKYYDTSNVLQTLNSANYLVMKPTNLAGWVVPVYGQQWPSSITRDDAVVIRYTSGGHAPEAFKHLLKLKVEEAYDGKDYGPAIERLLNQLQATLYH